jgi:hypothetical protein
MFRSVIPVLICFLFGMAVPVGLEAHSILTSPMPMSAKPSETQTLDAALSTCSMVNEWLKARHYVPDCRIVPWVKSVDFTLGASATEAVAMCAGTAKAAGRTRAFAGKGWQVSIYSGYSTAPIETCHLT